MGRYYTGDIEGKMWFGVQPSTDPEFFGGEACEPDLVTYHFDKYGSDEIETGIATCVAELGDHLPKLRSFFETHNGYTDDDMQQHLGVDQKQLYDKILPWYARLILGNKILGCVKKNDYCQFEVEL